MAQLRRGIAVFLACANVTLLLLVYYRATAHTTCRLVLDPEDLFPQRPPSPHGRLMTSTSATEMDGMGEGDEQPQGAESPEDLEGIEDIQMFSSVRGDAEMNGLIEGWGYEFPNFEFIVSDPHLHTTHAKSLKLIRGRNYTVVTTRSVNGGIRETLCVKLWLYLRHKCIEQAEADAAGKPLPKWMMRVDADTFVVPQRLVQFVRTLDHKKNQMVAYMWYGQFGVWPSGGAGLLISRAAYRKMCNPHIMHFNEEKAKKESYDDVMLGHFATWGNATMVMEPKRFNWRYLTPEARSNRKELITVHEINSIEDLAGIGSILYLFQMNAFFPNL